VRLPADGLGRRCLAARDTPPGRGAVETQESEQETRAAPRFCRAPCPPSQRAGSARESSAGERGNASSGNEVESHGIAAVFACMLGRRPTISPPIVLSVSIPILAEDLEGP
jgi:hypothetical protein